MSEPMRKLARTPDAVTIRLAIEDDADAIADILLEAFSVFEPEYTPESFAIVTPRTAEISGRFAEGPMWVAVDEEQVVGTVSVTHEPEGLYIRSMAVRPIAQGRGVGHGLLKAVDEYAAGTEVDRVFLYTTYFVPGAKEMYEKHGFVWVRDTPAEEWYGTAGLEMDKRIDRTNVVGS